MWKGPANIRKVSPGRNPIGIGPVTWLAGAKAEGGNRITLLRDTKGDGNPDVRTVFLDHLNSPFGVVLVGHDLYVANTDAIVRFPYQEGQTSITTPGTKLTELPGGPIDHHWTKALLASADGSSSMSELAQIATSLKTELKPSMSALPSGRSTAHRALIAFSPAAYGIPQVLRGNLSHTNSGPSSTNAMRSDQIWFRTI
jgi:hypothetical protein